VQQARLSMMCMQEGFMVSLARFEPIPTEPLGDFSRLARVGVPGMDVGKMIQGSSLTHEMLTALSVDAESLRNIEAVPAWCMAPLNDVADIRARIPALLGVVHLTSQQLRNRECDAVKKSLLMLVEALGHLE